MRHKSTCRFGNTALGQMLMIGMLLLWTRFTGGVELEFNRDIRPILSENCFYCHGQVHKHREAKLRLDVRDQALRDLGGYAAIVPGKPAESEIISRLMSHEDDERMPPPKAGKQVTAAQIDTIRQWIAAGVDYQKHWAFETPRRAALPEIKLKLWPKNDVDHFVLAKLEANGLAPSKKASLEKWLRRASFDLIGLPSSPQEIDEFIADVRARSELAYGAAADRLLASERFGERGAIEWLDVARYADTHGFNNDSSRTIWRWRDWIIEAFNFNKPYDQLITEQLAGDLLPNATLEQLLATGFGRNHVINSEGGIIDEEYRVEYVADRVRTTSMAFLGLTMECSRCHDHKFDPITQKDYYQFYAFFNNIAEHGEDGRVANAVPMMAAPTHAQSALLAEQEKELAAIDEKIKAIGLDSLNRQGMTEKFIADAQAAEPRGASFVMDVEATAPKPKAWSFPGTTPALVPGVKGNAWTASGSGPLAKLEADALVLYGKLGATVSFWLNSAADAPNDVALMSNLNHQGSPADAGFGKGTEIRLVDGEIEFVASGRFPVYAMRLRSDGAHLTQNRWRHLTITFTPPNPELLRIPWSSVRIFVDGKELPTRLLNDDLANVPGPQPWLLGNDNSKDAPAWKGSIDEWKTFPRALTTGGLSFLARGSSKQWRISAANWNGPVTRNCSIGWPGISSTTGGTRSEYSTRWCCRRPTGRIHRPPRP